MSKPSEHKSALNVMKGIEQPPQIHKDALHKIASKRQRQLSVEEFVEGLRSGNRTILSKAITLVESSLHAHREKAQQIIARCLEFNAGVEKETGIPSRVTRNASRVTIRIGITGVPGVGKSTFIEALGRHLTSQGHKLAVLAVDPSSTRSKGSILGDKTRMEDLANDPNAFIRPSPSGGSLGGVARKTRESIILCEAAGFDVIFVETVGVGQSETAVHSMVDFFLLLMLAGAGDELQGIKRGIIEMADAILINKADGDNLKRAQMAKAEYTNALHLFPPPPSGWSVPVGLCSSVTREGIPEVWKTVMEYLKLTMQNGYFAEKRKEQNRQVMYEAIEEALKHNFHSRKDIQSGLYKLEKEIVAGIISPYLAAQQLLEKYFEGKK
jgi:LAO/AO transport system kinase